MNPADLFLEYWYKVRILSSSTLTRVMLPDEKFCLAVELSLSIDEGDQACTKIIDLISQQSVPLRDGLK